MIFGSLLLLIVACGNPAETPNEEAVAEPESTSQARVIITEAISAAGLDGLNEAAFVFRFRDKEYRYQQTGGTYTYERWWTDTTTNEVIRDVLDNEGFVRYAAGQEAELTPKQYKDYSNSVNSVIYFAFMPWVLQDPAVVPVYLGQETIRGEALDKIGITFAGPDAGNDSGDQFRYWFTPQTRQLKYLAYNEPGNKFPRFRVAYNQRQEAGLSVMDYYNYNLPGDSPSPVDDLAPAYGKDELNLLSKIDLVNIRRVGLQTDRRRGDAELGE